MFEGIPPLNPRMNIYSYFPSVSGAGDVAASYRAINTKSIQLPSSHGVESFVEKKLVKAQTESLSHQLVKEVKNNFTSILKIFKLVKIFKVWLQKSSSPRGCCFSSLLSGRQSRRKTPVLYNKYKENCASVSRRLPSVALRPSERLPVPAVEKIKTNSTFAAVVQSLAVHFWPSNESFIDFICAVKLNLFGLNPEINLSV